MAFIYNIKTKVMTECINVDVIKICKKEPLNYIVEDKKEDLEKSINQLELPDEKVSTKVSLSKMKLDDLKVLATSLGLETDGLNCDELRKVIKDEQEGK